MLLLILYKYVIGFHAGGSVADYIKSGQLL